MNPLSLPENVTPQHSSALQAISDGEVAKMAKTSVSRSIWIIAIADVVVGLLVSFVSMFGFGPGVYLFPFTVLVAFGLLVRKRWGWWTGTVFHSVIAGAACRTGATHLVGIIRKINEVSGAPSAPRVLHTPSTASHASITGCDLRVDGTRTPTGCDLRVDGTRTPAPILFFCGKLNLNPEPQ